MTLSTYHQKHASQSDTEIQNKANIKKQELITIFKKVSLNTNNNPIRIAILGCGDKRFIAHHDKIFKNVLKKNIEITTFDITINHLGKEQNILQHDCTLPLPNPPYDIIYSHVLLKFIKTEKQFDILKNSFNALKSGGIAIHGFDWEEIKEKNKKLPDNFWAVPLNQWEKKLTKTSIKYKEIPLKYGLALILLRK